MTEWGWTPERNLGIWRHGAGWLRPLATAAPYLTVGVLLLMLFFVGGTMSAAKGVLFDLPAGDFTDVGQAELVALVMPVQRETTVFFDDSRYLVGDAASMRNFADSVAARLERCEQKTLLVMADRRVSADSLLAAVSAAKRGGASKVLVAGRRDGGGE